MSETTIVWFAVGLDVAMVIYTLWVLALARTSGGARAALGGVMLGWLAILYLGLSARSVFPADITGIVFLAIVFVFVGIVGALLFLFAPVRQLVLGLDQRQLLLLQGIRVFFGANFLMLTSLGALPKLFGILDGWTHIAAGFLGLVAAFSVAAGIQGVRRAWFANLFGLADILVVAGTLALILLPQISPHHSMMYAVFLPAPLWLWFHLISIWKLIREPDSVSRKVRA